MKKAIILTDGKAGHENQSRAFASALGLESQLLQVRFKSPFHKMLSYLFDRCGIRTMAMFEALALDAAPGCADLVIGTGSGTFYAAKTLSRKLGVKCAVILYPRGYHIPSFDCIMAPAFDNAPKAPNVVDIPVNFVANDSAHYDEGVKAFKARYTQRNAKALAVIVGGPNKCSTMSAEWMRLELEKIFAENPCCEKWVTTSRRTPKDVEDVVDSFPFDYKLIYSRDKFNPIPAFVMLAERLYVTAESTGMLSEACSFGKAEVRVMDNLKSGPHKFRRFLELLKSGGCVDGGKKADLAPAIEKAKGLL